MFPRMLTLRVLLGGQRNCPSPDTCKAEHTTPVDPHAGRDRRGPFACAPCVAPCAVPALPARPELTFQCIQDTAGGVSMTALKSSHTPEGMPVAPLAYKCIGCRRIPCRYKRPAELTDPVNPMVIDWGLVELGIQMTLAEVPAVFVVAYAYVNLLQ